jgi:hypothetical protein
MVFLETFEVSAVFLEKSLPLARLSMSHPAAQRPNVAVTATDEP